MTELRARESQILDHNKRMNKAALEAHDISDHLIDAAEQLAQAVASARDGSIEQRDRTAETATAMEEMNATVAEVAQHAQAATSSAEMAKNRPAMVLQQSAKWSQPSTKSNPMPKPSKNPWSVSVDRLKI